MASKYKDPATVTCSECAVRSSRRVADLLVLSATCPNCGSSLMQVGQTMRDGLDEWATFVAAMLMMLRLEDQLGTKFTDDEIHGVKTLRGLAGIVAARLGGTGETASRATELTTWALNELAHESLWADRRGCLPADDRGLLDFDAPLLDVLDPDRWNRPSTAGTQRRR